MTASEGDVPTAARAVKEDAKTASDNDTADTERPVRRKLQETRITSDGNPDVETARLDDRGRLKKRSHEDLQSEQEVESVHRRKRSRDTKDDEDEADRQTTPEQKTHKDDVLSPKKKRSLDQLQEGRGTLSEEKPGVEGEGEKTGTTEGERETKRHRDASKERQSPAKPSLPPAFLNTSAVSPFASLASKPSGEESKAKVTSPSAFAASGLASFAGKEQSPFGALGKSANTPSVFSKPATTTTAPEDKKPAGSGFAAAATTNTGASGFAVLGASSGFGGSFGASTAGKQASFASSTGSSFGGTPAKPFGADTVAEKEEDEEGNATTGTFGKEKEDERFFEQQIETGEEEEQTYFSSKAKLFHFSDKIWKERGVGTFKVNVKQSQNSDDSSSSNDDDSNNNDNDDNDRNAQGKRHRKKSARMIMRADGVLRVMLNSPIFKGMPVGDVSGDEPKGKQLNLASVEDGKTVPLLLRLGNAESAKELYHVIIELQKHM